MIFMWWDLSIPLKFLDIYLGIFYLINDLCKLISKEYSLIISEVCFINSSVSCPPYCHSEYDWLDTIHIQMEGVGCNILFSTIYRYLLMSSWHIKFMFMLDIIHGNYNYHSILICEITQQYIKYTKLYQHKTHFYLISNLCGFYCHFPGRLINSLSRISYYSFIPLH